MDTKVDKRDFPNINEMWEIAPGIVEVRTRNSRVFRVFAERDFGGGKDARYDARFEERVVIRVGELEITAWRSNLDTPLESAETRHDCIKLALKCVDEWGESEAQTVWVDPFSKTYHANMVCDGFPPLAISMKEGVAEADGYTKCTKAGCYG